VANPACRGDPHPKQSASRACSFEARADDSPRRGAGARRRLGTCGCLPGTSGVLDGAWIMTGAPLSVSAIRGDATGIAATVVVQLALLDACQRLGASRLVLLTANLACGGWGGRITGAAGPTKRPHRFRVAGISGESAITPALRGAVPRDPRLQSMTGRRCRQRELEPRGGGGAGGVYQTWRALAVGWRLVFGKGRWVVFLYQFRQWSPRRFVGRRRVGFVCALRCCRLSCALLAHVPPAAGSAVSVCAGEPSFCCRGGQVGLIRVHPRRPHAADIRDLHCGLDGGPEALRPRGLKGRFAGSRSWIQRFGLEDGLAG